MLPRLQGLYLHPALNCAQINKSDKRDRGCSIFIDNINECRVCLINNKRSFAARDLILYYYWSAHNLYTYTHPVLAPGKRPLALVLRRHQAQDKPAKIEGKEKEKEKKKYGPTTISPSSHLSRSPQSPKHRRDCLCPCQQAGSSHLRAWTGIALDSRVAIAHSKSFHRYLQPAEV